MYALPPQEWWAAFEKMLIQVLGRQQVPASCAPTGWGPVSPHGESCGTQYGLGQQRFYRCRKLRDLGVFFSLFLYFFNNTINLAVEFSPFRLEFQFSPTTLCLRAVGLWTSSRSITWEPVGNTEPQARLRPPESGPVSQQGPPVVPRHMHVEKPCSTPPFLLPAAGGLHPVFTLRLEILVDFQIFKKKDTHIHTRRNSFLCVCMMSFILPGLHEKEKRKLHSSYTYF